MTELCFTVHPTPVGDVMIATREERIVALQPLQESPHSAVARIGGNAPAIEKTTRASSEARKQLDAYFAGRRREFDLPLDWDGVRGFLRDALQAVCRIPYGETAGYGEVAAMAGHPRAARAVGTACATTPFSIVVPVHRVVRADGSLGEYGGHPEIKEQLLRREGALPGPAILSPVGG